MNYLPCMACMKNGCWKQILCTQNSGFGGWIEPAMLITTHLHRAMVYYINIPK